LTPQQLFGWRREARRRSESVADGAPFVPVLVEAADNDACRTDKEAPRLRSHAVELEIGGASVFIWRDADAVMVKAIIGALKAGK
jgi:transposase